jgi:23S rRNA (adenine2503-C2)-methyltransferase
MADPGRLKQTGGFVSAPRKSASQRQDETAPALELLGLAPEELGVRLGEHFDRRGQPSFRVQQVLRWIYETDIGSLEEMTNLPREERDALSRSFRFTELEATAVARSKDGTAKHLWSLDDGEKVESVLIPTDDRLTLCISSQAGCAMGCTFCATGWAGFARQLTAGEIVAQYRASRRWAREEGYGAITNIVYMGMGEPLANRSALHPSLSILNRGFGVGARRITVSTVGVVPGILELAARPEQFGLALSLHSPRSELRRSLIPLERRHPLPELMEALRTFREGKGRRVTFEYTMIRDVNDAEELAPELATLAREVQAFVNLIPFNPIPYQDWQPSTRERMESFRKTLESAGIAVAIREPRGRDIDAACGQLRANAQVGAPLGSPVSAPTDRSAPSEPDG